MKHSLVSKVPSPAHRARPILSLPWTGIEHCHCHDSYISEGIVVHNDTNFKIGTEKGAWA